MLDNLPNLHDFRIRSPQSNPEAKGSNLESLDIFDRLANGSKICPYLEDCWLGDDLWKEKKYILNQKVVFNCQKFGKSLLAYLVPRPGQASCPHTPLENELPCLFFKSLRTIRNIVQFRRTLNKVLYSRKEEKLSEVIAPSKYNCKIKSQLDQRHADLQKTKKGADSRVS